MKDEEFDAFFATAVSELETKQAALTARWNLGGFARFLFDQPTASLQFIDSSGQVHLRASVIPIGTYSSRSNTWKWSWANDSFLEPLRVEAGRLRELYSLTGFQIFESPVINAEPDMAGEIAAMSVKHLGALGCYRAPSAHSDLYLAIMDLGPGAAN